MKTFMVFHLVFANKTILSCFPHFFLIIDIYFLISAVIAQTFIHTDELVITKETPNNEANAEIETQPLTAETKTRKCSK